jgi:hypothetical protein
LNSPNEGPGKRFIFEFATFLVMAARGCLDEPHIYSSFRLLDAVSRLAEIHEHYECIGEDAFLLRVKETIDAEKFGIGQSERGFVKLMDGIVERFAEELMKRYEVC